MADSNNQQQFVNDLNNPGRLVHQIDREETMVKQLVTTGSSPGESMSALTDSVEDNTMVPDLQGGEEPDINPPNQGERDSGHKINVVAIFVVGMSILVACLAFLVPQIHQTPKSTTEDLNYFKTELLAQRKLIESLETSNKDFDELRNELVKLEESVLNVAKHLHSQTGVMVQLDMPSHQPNLLTSVTSFLWSIHTDVIVIILVIFSLYQIKMKNTLPLPAQRLLDVLNDKILNIDTRMEKLNELLIDVRAKSQSATKTVEEKQEKLNRDLGKISDRFDELDTSLSNKIENRHGDVEKISQRIDVTTKSWNNEITILTDQINENIQTKVEDVKTELKQEIDNKIEASKQPDASSTEPLKPNNSLTEIIEHHNKNNIDGVEYKVNDEYKEIMFEMFVSGHSDQWPSRIKSMWRLYDNVMSGDWFRSGHSDQWPSGSKSMWRLTMYDNVMAGDWFRSGGYIHDKETGMISTPSDGKYPSHGFPIHLEVRQEGDGSMDWYLCTDKEPIEVKTGGVFRKRLSPDKGEVFGQLMVTTDNTNKYRHSCMVNCLYFPGTKLWVEVERTSGEAVVGECRFYG